MALNSCPECTREVSSKATSCPHCGATLRPTGLDTSFTGNARSCCGCIAFVVIIFIVLMIVGSLSAEPVHAQQRQQQDVVYLKDGGIVRGTVVEIVPNESVLIQTADLSRFRYRMDQIERMTKEAVPSVTTRRSPVVAIVLSGLIMGGGQAYNGQWGKGLLYFGGGAVLASGAVNSEDPGMWQLGLLTLYVINLIDAGQTAQAINLRVQPPTSVAPARVGLSVSIPTP